MEAVPSVEIFSLEELHFRRNCKVTEEETQTSDTITDTNTSWCGAGAYEKQICPAVKEGVCS
jgi:hypothetical protein